MRMYFGQSFGTETGIPLTEPLELLKERQPFII